MLLLALFTIESGDDRTFIIELYKQYYSLLFDESYKIVKNRYDAEDVVQEFIVYICNHIVEKILFRWSVQMERSIIVKMCN